jgi:hypothetical protein
VIVLDIVAERGKKYGGERFSRIACAVEERRCGEFPTTDD